MHDRFPPFIGVRAHRNRTPTGRRTSTPARRAARYFAYGHDRRAEEEGRQRGQWYGPDGNTRSHREVLAWVRREGLSHRYTFEALLTVREGDLDAADFCRAMQAGESVKSWRLLAHDDTHHRHAHVLFFGDQRLPKERFLQWQARVRAELARLQQQRGQEAQEKIEQQMLQAQLNQESEVTY